MLGFKVLEGRSIGEGRNHGFQQNWLLHVKQLFTGMFKKIFGFILSQLTAMFAENRSSKYGEKEGEHACVSTDLVCSWL